MRGKITKNELTNEFGQYIDEAYNTANTALTQANGLRSELDSGISNAATLSIGANTIKHTGKTSTFPKIHFEGMKIVNLLGKDGNFDTEGATAGVGNGWSEALKGATKSIANGRQKIVTTATDTSYDRYIYYKSGYLVTGKYYFAACEIEADGIGIGRLYLNGGTAATSINVYSGNKRVGVKCYANDTTTYSIIRAGVVNNAGTIGTVYFNNYMVVEITADEYNNLTVDQLLAKYPYVESAQFLTNPCFENRRYNLIRNGNCEDGVGYWTPNVPSALTSFSVENGKFKVVTSGPLSMYQVMPVERNKSYYLIGNHSVAAPNSRIRMFNSTQSTIILDDANGTFNSGDNTSVVVRLSCYVAGTFYFDSIMLVEGIAAPAAYASCDREVFVVEGQFADEDELVLENGKLSILRYWEHTSPLFGKDYAWVFHDAYTGYKCFKIPFDNSKVSATVDEVTVKYDGTILKPNILSTAGIQDASNIRITAGLFYIMASNASTGWTDTIHPNTDEIKAYMNGWKAVNYNSSRYVAWISVVDGSAPAGTPQTTISVASVAGATSLTVTDASVFSVGNNILIQYGASGTGYAWRVIQAINGNVIALNSSLTSTASIGFFVYKCDNGAGDVSLLTWCKNNVAPGYEGYRLHYMLANPEPVTDENVRIKGDLWNIVPGDNYVDVECGIVLGEVASPIKSDDGSAYGINIINKSINWATGGNSQLLNKTEDILGVFQNNIRDMRWAINTALAYGNKQAGIAAAQFDANATYTVDYQILKTLHAQSFGSLDFSYAQDVFTAIESIAGAVEEKQQHDSALDTLVDMSVYEVFNAEGFNRMPVLYQQGTSAQFEIIVPFIAYKEVVPIVTINNISISKGYTVYDPSIVVTNKFTLYKIQVSQSEARFMYTTSDTQLISDIRSMGMVVSFTATFDCRGRI